MKNTSLLKQGILLAFLLWFMGFQSYGQKPSLTTTLEPAEIHLGKRSTLTLKVENVNNHLVSFPLLYSQATKDFEVISTKIDSVFDNQHNLISLTQKAILTSFTLDSVRIPSFSVWCHEPNKKEEQIELLSDSLLLFIRPIAIDTTAPIKDIRPIVRVLYSFDEIAPTLAFWMITLSIIFTCFRFIHYVIRRRKQKKPLFFTPEKPQIPAHKKALEALEELNKQKLWQNNHVKRYYSELTDIIRIYLDGRFEIAAIEMTSNEIQDAITAVSKKEKISKETLQKLNELLMLADLVKFAKCSPLPDEHEASMNNGKNFILETIPTEQDKEHIEETQDPIVKS